MSQNDIYKPLDYTKYITSAHKDRPKFVATVKATAGPFAGVQSVLYSLIDGHHIDNAIGAQLDTLGEWIGQTRYLKRPLDDIYFTWDDIDTTGWDSGIWKEKYSATEGLLELDDDSYRFLLKMRISTNAWRGNSSDAYDIWQTTYGDATFVLFTDNGDMSIDVGFSGYVPAPIKAMIRAGLSPFKPESVEVNSYFTNNSGAPMFAWDIQNNALAGWDSGAWPEEFKAMV